jgi:hypothetical protein
MNTKYDAIITGVCGLYRARVAAGCLLRWANGYERYDTRYLVQRWVSFIYYKYSIIFPSLNRRSVCSLPHRINADSGALSCHI